MNEKNITKNVVFEITEYAIVRNLVEKEGYGQRGFSIALRKIIREWARLYSGGWIKPQTDPDPNQGYLDWVTDIGESAVEKAAE
jgi:hypothetical protein